MSHNMYYLRAYRKRSRLTQADIAFLLGLPEHTSVCHWESGRRKPTVEAMILYHLLFGIPDDALLGKPSDAFVKKIIERAKELLRVLLSLPQDRQVQSRVRFLEDAITRLCAQIS